MLSLFLINNFCFDQVFRDTQGMGAPGAAALQRADGLAVLPYGARCVRPVLHRNRHWCLPADLAELQPRARHPPG